MKSLTLNLQCQFLIGIILASAQSCVWAQENAGTSLPTPADTPVANSPGPADPWQVSEVLGPAIPLSGEQPSAGKPPVQLSEVVVTSTKRATPVRSIPGTINVLNGDDLEKQGVQSLAEIIAEVPGVSLDVSGTGGAEDRVTIRGISSDNGTNATTGTLIGDTPFSDPFAPKVQLDPNPFDMATVEVLKGPQGTLFGGTGLNGMIRYVPQAPELDRFRVKYFGQLSSYPGNGGSAWSEGGAVNIPFANGTAAVRLMGFYRDAPGYVDNIRTGVRDANSIGQYGFRGMVEWHPNEVWKISLLGTTQHTIYNDLSFTDNNNGQLSRDDTPRQSPQTSAYSLGTLTVQRSFYWADAISLTSVFDKRYDAFLDASRAELNGQIPLLAGADHNRSEGVTQEFRLVSSPSQAPWKWLAGAFLFNENLYDCANIGAADNLPSLVSSLTGLLPSVLTPPCPGNAQKLEGEVDVDNLIANVRLREEALFGELTREIGSQIDLTLGTRAYRTQSSGTVSFGGPLYSAEHPTGPSSADAGIIEYGLSPKGSVIFHPTRNLRTYFTISRGFRFGGPQIGLPDPLSTASFPSVYKSDSLWNSEFGIRTDWFQRTLRFDASLYHIRWKNPQIFQVTADGLTNYIANVGGAKGDGVDMELRYKPRFLYGLSLTEAVSENHTVTTEPYDSPTGGLIPTDSRFPLSPHWQTSTTLQYELQVSSWQLDALLRETYSASACSTIDCTRQVFGYHTLNFNLALSPSEYSFFPQLSVGMNNITDTRGKSDIVAVASGSAGGSDSVTYIAPRMLILRLSGSF